MDNDQILINICEMVYQRSAINKASVPASTVKKDTPKLKKPRAKTFKQHFKEEVEGDAPDAYNKSYPFAIWTTNEDGDQFIFTQVRPHWKFYVQMYRKYHINPWRKNPSPNDSQWVAYGMIHTNPKIKCKDIPTQQDFENEFTLENI